MATNKEAVVKSEKQNGSSAINQMNWYKRFIAWKAAALICVINASAGLFANGSFVGWTSFVDISGNVTFPDQDQLKIVTDEEKWKIFSAIALTAALSPLIVHRVWHLIGTKLLIVMANILVVVAWILVMLNSNEYLICLTGRSIGGFAIGVLHYLVPLYINDIVPNHQKPICQSIMQLQFVLGILSQYLLSLTKSSFILSLLPAILSVVICIIFILMPESPRYLSYHERTNEAMEILVSFKKDDHRVQSDLQLWSRAHHKTGYMSVLKEDFGITYAIPVFGLFIFEQLIGAVPILFYLHKIFKRLDEKLWADSPELPAILCVIVFAVSILLPHIIRCKDVNIKDKLMWSANVMAAILGVLGLYCHYTGSFASDEMDDFRYIPLICLALFYFLFATGPHRLSNEYAEKIIPEKCYFTMHCMLTTTSWLLIYVITRMLPQLIDHIGVGWVFWFMAVMCLLMSVFVRLFVPDLSTMPEKSRLFDNSSESNSEA